MDLESDRHREQQRARDRQQPPPVRAVVRGHEHGGGRGDHTNRDAPVVADDEVVPELSELREPLHETATSRTTELRRATRTRTNATPTTNAISPSSDASAPGQLMPAPSALQKMPKAVSITPTPNFNVFSGTRVSGACTIVPAIST